MTEEWLEQEHPPIPPQSKHRTRRSEQSCGFEPAAAALGAATTQGDEGERADLTADSLPFLKDTSAAALPGTESNALV